MKRKILYFVIIGFIFFLASPIKALAGGPITHLTLLDDTISL